MQAANPISISLLIIFALFIPVSIAGLMATVRFWRGGRIDDHPVCRKCGYDLVGTPEPRTACPECGADLAQQKAIRTGNRRRRTRAAIVSGLVTFAAVAMLGLAGFNLVIKTNLNPYKPFWLLKLEATTPALGSKGGALDELLNRTKNQTLTTSQLDALMAATLQVQADASIQWDETFGDLFGALFLQGVGTAKQHEQYAMGVYQYEANTRPRVPLGYNVQVGTRRTPYRGQGDKAHYYFVEHGDRIEIDGLTTDRTHRGGSGSGFASGGGSVGGGTSFPTHTPPFDQLKPGHYTVHYTEPTEIHLGSAVGPLIAAFDRSADSPIELLPADAEEIELFSDPAAAAAMEAGTSIENNRIEVRPMRHNPDIRVGRIYVVFDGTTAPLGYQVLALHDGKEYELGRVARPGPTQNTSHGFQQTWPDDLDADRVDLIFRPDPDAARDTVDVYRILDHEFVIHDVEVVHEP